MLYKTGWEVAGTFALLVALYTCRPSPTSTALAVEFFSNYSTFL